LPRAKKTVSRNGHRQRLRDKFLAHGLSVFTDEEVIELLLTMGTPRQDCKDRARAAMKRFGSLAGVLEAEADELQKIEGIGPKNAFAIKFIHQVARRFLSSRLEGRSYLNSAQDVVDHLCYSLSFKDREIFSVLFLDASNGIIAVEELFEGSVSTATVYPDQLFKRALNLGAVSMILAHNHPSGTTRPSGQDISLTRRLCLAAMLLDIRIVDHIIIGGPGNWFSFQEEGLMNEIRSWAEKRILK
jgi:DNA repair protein RadC